MDISTLERIKNLNNKYTYLMETLSHPLIFAFIVIWVLEFYLFGMQRASLIISRSNNIDWQSIGKQLLPSWHPFTWIVRVAKYGLLITIFIFINWKPAIILLVVSFLLSSFLPIPYKLLYKRIFRKRARKMQSIDQEVGQAFKSILNN